MADLHESLRHLIEARGPGVLADADEFRGALDDFLTEAEASTGELNLLVDAVRLGAVQRLLAVVEQGGDPAASVRDVGTALARDRATDDPARSQWALAAIGYALGRVPVEVVEAHRGPTAAPPPAPPVPPPPPPADPAAPAPASSVPAPAEVVATRPVPGTVPSPPAPVAEGAPSGHGRRGTLVGAALAVVLVLVVAAAAGWWLTRDGDPAGGPSGAASEQDGGSGEGQARAPLDPAELVVQLADQDEARLYRVDVASGAALALTDGPDDRNPSLSPDRRHLVTLRGDEPGKVAHLVDVETGGAGARLFAEDGPCARVDRVAWSPDGTRVAAVCVTEANRTVALHVADVREQLPLETRELPAPDAKGTVTWVSDGAIVYQRLEDGGGSGLFLLDVDAEVDPVRLTPAVAGRFFGQPDHSAEAGLVLYLVNEQRTGPGELWVMAPDGSGQRRIGTDVSFPVWSPDGQQVAFVRDDRLLVAPADDLASARTVEVDRAGRPGPPVWASR